MYLLREKELPGTSGSLLVIQEAESRRITVQRHTEYIVCKTLSQKKKKKPITKKRAGGVAQNVRP
jgi:hypothetical protein